MRRVFARKPDASKPKTLLQLQQYISRVADAFYEMNRLIKIACTLPVSTCACERSFSTLRIVKNYMRTTMVQNRLQSLMILGVHSSRSRKIDLHNIVEKFDTLENLQERRTTYDSHGCTLLVGNADNDIIMIKKIRDFQLLEMGRWSKRLDVPRAQKGDNLRIHWISDSYVGLDVHKSFVIQYDATNFHVAAKENNKKVLTKSYQADTPINGDQRVCYHKCLNKMTCGHWCCKTGVQVNTSVPKKTKIENFMDQLHNKMNAFPSKKVKIETEIRGNFLKTTATGLSKQPSEECLTPSLDEEWLEEMIMDEDFTAEESMEENNNSEIVSFDINLDEVIDEDMLTNDIQNADVKQNMPTTTEERSLNTSAQPAMEQREIWPKEKWLDPVAAGELLEYCVNFLSGKCE
ncbi:putative ATP-dependent DNA helicase HFM1 [Araneus ventricosus]|uniref:Putative ATP-dependent DNA helicase HFM1 n=1 Tax=Araneus ventricosus TaxID=182803 RepID=A0A4Y2P103_ARAVE|nr:putative ATP-dependent DNA helicase HFM1 [Araneus ventricosus]